MERQSMVQREAEDFQGGDEKWRFGLITYVVGECHGYINMSRYIAQNWSIVSKPKIFLHEEGYYIVKFQQKSDIHTILFISPFLINNRLILLKS